jgi:iron(III) transport system substrate-binding protein
MTPWSSELFQTIRLAQNDLLDVYRPAADDIPDRYKDTDGKWIAFGLRARVIGYNTESISEDGLPQTWSEIAEPKWTGKLGVADPHFGTTTGHFAAMYALWGEAAYTDFVGRLHGTLQGKLLSGNATAARLVGSGTLVICATDTDDVYARQCDDEPIALSYPDLGDGGTLLVPNSVAFVRGAPHPETAKKLIDFLCSAQAERLLAESDSGNFPVRAALRDELGMTLPPETKVAFTDIADAIEPAMKIVSQTFTR